MSENFNFDNIGEALKGAGGKAEDYLKNPEGLEALLQKLEASMKEVPYVGEGASKLPLMISMIRSYITKDYDAVSPKVVVSLIAMVLYLLKKKDLIPDNVPIIGRLDDIAAIALTLKLTEPELKAYSEWRDGGVSFVKSAEEPEETAECVCEEPAEETAECACEEAAEEPEE